MNKQGNAWRPEEESLLAELWAAGKTSAEIGAALKRTAEAVLARARLLGQPRRQGGGRKSKNPQTITSTWTKADTAELFLLAAQGKSLRALAERFGRDSHAIQRKLDKPPKVILPPKPCITCRTPFVPEAKVLFMCPRCRAGASDSNQFTPGNGGRWHRRGAG